VIGGFPPSIGAVADGLEPRPDGPDPA